MAGLTVTLEDTDSVIRYHPYADGDPALGWQTTFEGGSEPNQSNTWRFGIGNAQRTTSAAGANFEFTFYGTSLTLIGDAHNSSFSIAVDGDEGTQHRGNSETNVLAKLDNLSTGEHHVVVTLNDAQPQMSFDRAIFQPGIGSNRWNETITFRETDRWQFSGTWNFGHAEPPMPDLSAKADFTYTRSQNDRAMLQFQGSAVYLYGGTAYDRAVYEVQVDGKPTTLNGTSELLVHDCVIYFRSGLDPKVNHTLQLTNTDGRSLILLSAVVVHEIEVTESVSSEVDTKTAKASLQTNEPIDNSPHDNGGVSPGAIVGVVVGAVMLTIFLFLGVFCIRRRRRNRAQISQSGSSTSHSLLYVRNPNDVSSFNGSVSPLMFGSQIGSASPYFAASSVSSPSVPPTMVRSSLVGANFSAPIAQISTKEAMAMRRDVQEFAPAPPAYSS
ncbi:hypothetical protein BKA62DRAFT_835398 [Auriculariales sp. MPI-PUGE-AT-0066]|nr:hypothetical protein BKA62DRAFT_835398 [Auriculariales sp. MPI-PUGE-AT-0066]